MKTSVEQFPYPVVEPEVVDNIVWEAFWSISMLPAFGFAFIAVLFSFAMCEEVRSRVVLLSIAMPMILGLGLLLSVLEVNSQAKSKAKDATYEQNIASIEENYDVTVVKFDYYTKDAYSVLIRTDTALLTCTQHVTEDNMYSVFCGEGTVQTPLEGLLLDEDN